MQYLVDRFAVDCAIAATDVPLPRFMDWALDGLGALVRHDSACWAIGTHEPHAAHIVHMRGQPPELMAVYETGLYRDDVARQLAAAQPGRAVNDVESVDQWSEEMGRLREAIGRPFGIEQVMLLSLPHDAHSGLHHLLMLWRSGPHDCFDEDDRLVMERAAPHMVAGYRVAQRLAVAAAARTEAARGYALCDRQGVLHSFDDRFVRALRRRWPDWSGMRLPDAVIAAFGGDRLVDGALDLRIEPHGDLVALAAATARAALLTPGQRRVAELFAAGATHREVADALGLSPATVRNHLQRSYAKLGVDSKIDLARLLHGEA